ncbi:MAG TPA: NADH-quinone oxidoreductase subunit A, partial [Thermoanaerobaculia bacterium]
MTHTFLPVLIMLIIAVVIGGVILALNWVLGRHQRNPSKLAPYESGVPLLDQNRKRINVRFYQIAMLFILFDIEAAFLYPWAVIYRDAA